MVVQPLKLQAVGGEHVGQPGARGSGEQVHDGFEVWPGDLGRDDVAVVTDRRLPRDQGNLFEDASSAGLHGRHEITAIACRMTVFRPPGIHSPRISTTASPATSGATAASRATWSGYGCRTTGAAPVVVAAAASPVP